MLQTESRNLLSAIFVAAWCAVAGVDISAQDYPRLARIDEIVAEGMASGDMPGAVVMVGTSDRLLHFQAYGLRQVEPSEEVMTLDTIFDLASITKPVATATSVMLLIERGLIAPEDAVSRHLPEFAPHGKDAITVEHLLTHTSGLIADNALRDYLDGPQMAWERICGLQPTAAPGEKFIYSDVGFIVLGKLIEARAESVDAFSRRHLFEPAGMTDTGFKPAADLIPRIAPTEKVDGQWRRGVVHDPRAHALGGVAGHAGLFSTAEDLAKYARMILGKGAIGKTRILGEATVQLMLRPRSVPSGTRAFGWDHRTGYSSNRGEGMSERAIGHGGFTGTGLWIDPEKDLFVIWLSSRLHPDGKGVVNKLIGRVGTVAVEVRNAE